MNRPLTADERRLVQWMLQNGKSGATKFLPQLDLAEVTPWQCPCGCASIDFSIRGYPAPPGGSMNIIADYEFGSEDDLIGVFLFARVGVLSGLEVYGLSGDAPNWLPSPENLRPLRPSY